METVRFVWIVHWSESQPGRIVLRSEAHHEQESALACARERPDARITRYGPFEPGMAALIADEEGRRLALVANRVPRVVQEVHAP